MLITVRFIVKSRTFEPIIETAPLDLAAQGECISEARGAHRNRVLNSTEIEAMRKVCRVSINISFCVCTATLWLQL